MIAPHCLQENGDEIIGIVPRYAATDIKTKMTNASLYAIPRLDIS